MFDKDVMWQDIAAAQTIGIGGHERPDGDCVGACLAVYNYIRENFAKEADVYVEAVPANLSFLKGSEHINTAYPYRKDGYDLFIALDCADAGRLGKAQKYLKDASKSYCIDHHETNPGFADENHILPEAAAACEAVFDLMDEDKISQTVAECLYTGIIHDTGVFQHSNTTRHTMEVAGRLLDYKIAASDIINSSFNEKTYLQNQILGRCLMESILCMDGRVVIAYVDRRIQALYGLVSSDTDGVVDQLRITAGVDVAVLLKEMNPRLWRVSMRTNHIVNAAEVCEHFGGGGHMHAAGCVLNGSVHDVINTLTREVEKYFYES